ncbi:MAG TPA: DUF2332 domain-containing protein [Caulobacteraceae bacterium]|jgi:hypothetical protein|nr:DUF2332 domain-containing protein [Caulobacteraceae bacterium]
MIPPPISHENDSAAAERLRRLFLIFGATQCAGRSAVYEALSLAIAGDERLFGLLRDTPSDQQRPSLLFACVNLLLATDLGHELAAYYPIHGGVRSVDERLAPAFSAFCEAHRGALAGLLRQRSTQTNEIRRCVALALGLGHVQARWPGPLALMEVGASAGLNLMFDHYRYRLGGPDVETGAGSPVVVSCEIRGAAPGASLLGAPPTITHRRGVDQHPIDLADPDARAWLEAFIWPEQVQDLATLRGAIELSRSNPAARVVSGEATADVARLIAELPGVEPVAVFTASLLSYLPLTGRRAFLAQLDEAAARRRVAWIFAEGPGLLATAGLTPPALSGPLAQRNSLYLVGASLRGAGGADTLLALADPYLRWLAPARDEHDEFHWVEERAYAARP